MNVKEFYNYCVKHNLEKYDLLAYHINRNTWELGSISCVDVECIHPNKRTGAVELYYDDDTIGRSDWYTDMVDNLIYEETPHYTITVYNPHIEIRYSAINKYKYPKANEGDYYIVVCIDEPESEYSYYRISLFEPKYIYGSDKLPAQCRSTIINAISASYRTGISFINMELNEEVIDPNILMPNYNLL